MTHKLDLSRHAKIWNNYIEYAITKYPFCSYEKIMGVLLEEFSGVDIAFTAYVDFPSKEEATIFLLRFS